MRISRRDFLLAGAGALAARARSPGSPQRARSFRLRYVLASSLYGTARLEEILPEVRKTGAGHIDIWPRVHGSQREQVEEMGHAAFAALLEAHGVRLGILTCYDLGPFRLGEEMRVARKLGASLLVCGSGGPRDLAGPTLREAVKRFAGKLRPQVAAAEEQGVTIGIENHGASLIESPDAQRWLVDEIPSRHLGIALAPYHLSQDPEVIARLIGDLGPRLVHFYAWQRGKGCFEKLPKEEELLQMPGRGPLDFKPVLAALETTRYGGWTEVFMHPVPRGVPILGTAAEVTAEVNRARRYLEACLEAL